MSDDLEQWKDNFTKHMDTYKKDASIPIQDLANLMRDRYSTPEIEASMLRTPICEGCGLQFNRRGECCCD